MKIILLLLWTGLYPSSENPADQIIGQYWINDKSGKIAIYKKKDRYFGKIIWRKEVRKDSKNPDPNLRKRSVIGLEFLQDFEYHPAKKQWIKGKVYSIENGGTYRGKIWL
ncbi:MAG: DUF2147 domain-containing protein, partial [Bacteroidota bacterium]